MTIQSLVHPLHSNLADISGNPMHIIGQLINDPYYTSHALRLFDGTRRDNHSNLSVAPDFDVRESEDYFFLEGELAGIASSKDVSIQWVGRQILLVNATVNEVDVEAEWGIHLPSNSKTVEIETSDTKDVHESAPHERQRHRRGDKDEHKRGLKVWMNERHKGHLQKSFSFPCDVDTEHMRAKLTNGLLKMIVPKQKTRVVESAGRVKIEE